MGELLVTTDLWCDDNRSLIQGGFQTLHRIFLRIHDLQSCGQIYFLQSPWNILQRWSERFRSTECRFSLCTHSCKSSSRPCQNRSPILGPLKYPLRNCNWSKCSSLLVSYRVTRFVSISIRRSDRYTSSTILTHEVLRHWRRSEYFESWF